MKTRAGRTGRQYSDALGNLRQKLISLPRPLKRLLLLSVDLASVTLAAVVALLVTSEHIHSLRDLPWTLLAGIAAATAPVFSSMGFYRTVVRYLRSRVLVSLVSGVTVLAAGIAMLALLAPNALFDGTTALVFWAFAILNVAGSRFIVRDFLHRQRRQSDRVIIYGAGLSGARLADLLTSVGDYLPIAFLDDSPALQGSVVAGLRVYSPAALGDLIARHGASLVLLAMPSASRARRAQILQQLESSPVRVQSIPDMSDLVSGKARFDELREIEVEDLLGRDPVPPRPDLIKACIENRSVMVTGAGGSIGSELSRQIIGLGAKRIVLVDHSEPALYAIDSELRAAAAARSLSVEIVPLLRSVVDDTILEEAMRAFQVSTVYHAAAYKHVPLVEYNMAAGARNNVVGTLRTAEAAERAKVENFVLVSTDKAVNPTNVMGATKRFAEIILQALIERGTNMKVCMVRFGNVLDSSGSVVPLFREQIRRGGPVTVTHPEIVRYFMTIPEAAQLVIQAGAMGGRGEVFLLDMGEPVRIVDLARRMIHLAGLEVRDSRNPEGDIEIVYTGLRPAEKLFEELLISGNAIGTEHPRIWKAQESCVRWASVAAALKDLDKAIANNDCETLRRLLVGIVGEYTPPPTLVDQVYGASRRSQERPVATVLDLPPRPSAISAAGAERP